MNKHRTVLEQLQKIVIVYLKQIVRSLTIVGFDMTASEEKWAGFCHRVQNTQKTCSFNSNCAKTIWKKNMCGYTMLWEIVYVFFFKNLTNFLRIMYSNFDTVCIRIWLHCVFLPQWRLGFFFICCHIIQVIIYQRQFTDNKERKMKVF